MHLVHESPKQPIIGEEKQSAKVFRILFDPYFKVKDVPRKVNTEFL